MNSNHIFFPQVIFWDGMQTFSTLKPWLNYLQKVRGHVVNPWVSCLLIPSTVKSHSSKILLSELWKCIMICIFILFRPFITHCAIQVYAPMGWKRQWRKKKSSSSSEYIKCQIYSDWLWSCHVSQLFCVRCGQINRLSLETYRITFVQVTMSVGSLYTECERPNRNLFAKLTQRRFQTEHYSPKGLIHVFPTQVGFKNGAICLHTCTCWSGSMIFPVSLWPVGWD